MKGIIGSKAYRVISNLATAFIKSWQYYITFDHYDSMYYNTMISRLSDIYQFRGLTISDINAIRNATEKKSRISARITSVTARRLCDTSHGWGSN